MPNLIILGMTLAAICMSAYHSSKHNEEQSRRYFAATGTPSHGMLDNHISGSVIAFCIFLAVVGTSLAMAVGN